MIHINNIFDTKTYFYVIIYDTMKNPHAMSIQNNYSKIHLKRGVLTDCSISKELVNVFPSIILLFVIEIS